MKSESTPANLLSIRSAAGLFLFSGAVFVATPALAGDFASGHANLSDSDGRLRTFSFTVDDDGDGYVTGSGVVNNRRLVDPLKTRVDLVCAWVDGDSVLVAGTYVSTGLPIIFGARDHGEGALDPTDELSLLHTFADDGGTGTYVNSLITDGDCSTLTYVVGLYGGVDSVIDTFTVMYEIEAGNVQVK